jgi:ATP-binding cassette subfamily C protein CydCD
VTPAGRRLLRASRAARVHLACTVALGAVSAALVVVQAVLLARIVERAFLRGFGVDELSGELAGLAAALAARALVGAGFEVSGRLAAARALSELRGRVTAHLLRARPGGEPDQRTGELATAAVQGVDALEDWFARYLPALALAAIVPPALLVYLAPRDLEATAILAVTVPLIPLFMVLIGRMAQSRTRARWRTLSLLSAHFLDVVRGLPTLRAFRREGAQARAIAAAGDRLRRETMATLRVAFLSALVLELLAMLGTALVAAAVGVQLVEGSLSLEAGLVVLLLAPELYAPLRQLGQQFHASADGLAAAERLFAVLDTPATVARPAAPRPVPDPGRHDVLVEGARFAYPQRPVDVLAGVDLALAPGTTTALVGPSGGGKTTLAALVLRLAEPTGGRVSCGGVDLRDIAPEQWWTQVAWVPQRARLFAGTVDDNVRLGAPGASDDQLREALAAAGAEGFVDALPDGPATRIGDGGRGLSAGQAQRIALARAFARDAPLIVLDEPTAHLDEASAAVVDAAVDRLCRGRTALLVVHRPALAARADVVVTLSGGRLVEDVSGERAVFGCKI